MAKPRIQGGVVRQLPSLRWGAYVDTATHGRVSIEKGVTYPDKTTTPKALRSAAARVELGVWAPTSDDPDDTPRGRIETFGHWGENYAAMTPRLKPSTRQNYFSFLRKSLARFRDMPLDAIRDVDVERWWRDMSEHPVNRRNSYGAMRRIMSHALKRGRIAESPCKVEGAFAIVAKDRPDHTRAEFDAVLPHVAEHWQPVLRALLASSARLCEVIGLNVADYADGKISITKQHTDDRPRPTRRAQSLRFAMVETPSRNGRKHIQRSGTTLPPSAACAASAPTRP